MKSETAVFGGGCFWCMEAVFQQLNGVISVTSGFAGGETENPSYQDVCTGKTGHAEVVKIEFDPEVIGYRDLLEVFFELHDPTSLNRQGNDAGTEYRSIILVINRDQKVSAERYIHDLEKSDKYKDKIVTEIKPLEKFYPAEDYHKDYYLNNSGQAYCRIVISPKLQHLREKFSHKLKINQ